MRSSIVVSLLLAACGGPMLSPDGSLPDGGSTPHDGGMALDSPATPGSDAGGGGPIAMVHYVGRFDRSDPSEAVFAWPGSAIMARFNGTAISAQLNDEGGENWFEVYIDGVAQTPFKAQAGAMTYPLATGLSAGEHDVALVRRTESFNGVTHFMSFQDATLVDSAGPTRLIEFIGDSITCGYGVLGSIDGNCTEKTGALEAETYAWGAVAARDLGAVNTAIAYSGIGVYQNGDGSTDGIMPQRFERTFADDSGSVWDFSYTPDVVVINLGTNDFIPGDPMQPYVDAMVAFVRQVRGHYAEAFIVMTTSPMQADSASMTGDWATEQGYLQQVVTMVGDPKVSYFAIDTQPVTSDNPPGCDYHPNVAAHAHNGHMLAAYIRTLTGW